MQYRREIDGLRAVAVMPVLLFHAGFATFKGGFVGVDIFFVISGYLITSIILAERAAGNFSIGRFYERRARRILPPLLVVLAFSAAAACVSLSPFEMRAFGKSMVAVSAFNSNLLFWKEAGYFDTSAELNPLLHTWSLGVEEQYYLFFPLLVALAWPWGRKALGLVFAIALAASLALAEWLSHTSPAAAFFLLPTRAWELAVGSLLALYLAGEPRPVPQGTANAATVLGVVLIAAAVFGFDESVPLPGVYALVPTVGAALLIWAATPHTVVGRILSSRVLVGIGLLSYSTYLWHQPILAFARHLATSKPVTGVLLLLVVGSLAAGYASWRLIEAPFRNRTRVSLRQLITFCLGGSVLVAAFGMTAYATKGLPQRLSQGQAEFAGYFENSLPAWRYFETHSIPQRLRFDCNFYDVAAYRAGRATNEPLHSIAPDCFTRNPKAPKSIFVWGDSHAQHLRPGLDRELPQSWQILQVASLGCAPSIGDNDEKRAYCVRSNAVALDTIKAVKPDVVLVAQEKGHQAQHMAELSRKLRASGVRHVVLAGPAPHWQPNLPSIVMFKLWENTPRHTGVGIDQAFVKLDGMLQAALPNNFGQTYISLMHYFCSPAGECVTYLGEDRSAGITSWDDAHLTPMASQAFARDVLVPEIMRISQLREP